MFENDVFENWLDKQANEIVVKLGEGQSLSSEEMIILVLKAQANPKSTFGSGFTPGNAAFTRRHGQAV
jgi:hypothetical protein